MNRRPDSTDRSGLAGLLALLCGLAAEPAISQDRFLLEGIFDAELHKTDSESLLLSRNDGDLSVLGRLQVWSAYQMTAGLQIYALAEVESDDAGGERETEAEIEQFALRYTSQSAHYFFLEAGKILSPLNAYANRHLSTRNPLIGQPYLYITSYPKGVQAAGSTRWLDYRAALLDSPDLNPASVYYEPGSAYRPALGLGVTPVQSLRIGLSWTEGPYLNRRLGDWLPEGAGWRDFDQRVLGVDFQFSRGYLELNGLWTTSEYDVPFHQQPTDDSSWYLELKYTFTPRFYGAARYGRNEVSFIHREDDGSWLARPGSFSDLEVGVGYRFSANTLFKVAYRTDDWSDGGAPADPIPGGRSFSLQLSHKFDLGARLRKIPQGF